jgi:lysophospholipase L1-like esterase
MRRLKQILLWLQTAWSILGVTLSLFLIMELGLRGVFWLKDRAKPQIPPDRRVVAEFDSDRTWIDVHYRELEKLTDRWEPYVYFRQQPFSGQTINIDAEGLRATWQPLKTTGGAGEKKQPLKILMLGGSSLWGFGARDDWTIPSLVARGLEKRGISAEIRNMAEIGYVSTQELIALVRELERGYRPDVVLFYDGVNDTTSALLEGTPAVTTNERNRAAEFNLLQSSGRLAAALARNTIQNSGSLRLAQSIRRRLGQDTSPKYPATAEAELRRLADGVVEGYLANVRMIEALGSHYGFRPLFVWQPVIFSKPRMVPFEQEEAEKYAWTRPLFQEVLARVACRSELTTDPAYHNTSAIFAETNEMVFIDFCHVTEQANARIAEVVTEHVIGAFKSGAPESRTQVR